jgi:hypothetical protein
MSGLKDIRDNGYYYLVTGEESRTFQNENTAVCYLWAMALRKHPRPSTLRAQDGYVMTNEGMADVDDAPDGMRATIRRLVSRMNREDQESDRWEELRQWADDHAGELVNIVKRIGVEHMPNVMPIIERAIRARLEQRPEKVWQMYNEEVGRNRVYR